jgi:hypothetical protein
MLWLLLWLLLWLPGLVASSTTLYAGGSEVKL